MPKFRGEKNEDIYDYIERFESSTTGLGDRAQVLGIRRAFQGAAKDWLDSINKDISYNELKKKIFERYASEAYSMRDRRKLKEMSYKLSANETMSSYIDQYLACATRIDSKITDDEEELVMNIITSFLPEVKSQLMSLHDTSTIQSLSDLRSLAKRFDSVALNKIESHAGNTLDELKNLMKTMQEKSLNIQKKLWRLCVHLRRIIIRKVT